jgi:hypothetical protein
MTTDGGIDQLRVEAEAEVCRRPDPPADVVVIAPVGTDPATHEAAGATWVLFRGWRDELRVLATTAPSDVWGQI